MNVIALDKTEGLKEGTTTYQISFQDGEQTSVKVFTDSHPSFTQVEEAITSFSQGDLSEEDFIATVEHFANLSAVAARKLVRVEDILDGRMVLEEGHLLVDGDPIDPALETHLLRLLKADGTPQDQENWRAFAKFVNKLYQNVAEDVRLQFFSWLKHEAGEKGFTLTSEGNVIGYKGCMRGSEDGVGYSIRTGPAIVDDEPMNGHIPYRVGSVVEMKRSQVTVDPTVACAAGLHVGTYAYANDFQQGILLTVEFDPRDIGSVPYDCNGQKVRVWRLKVLEVTTTQYEEPTWPSYDEEDYEDGYEEDTEEINYEDEDFYTVFDERVEEGDVIQFKYYKADGTTNTYQGTFIRCEDGLVHLYKDDDENSYRTFTASRMKGVHHVVEKAQEEGQAEASSQELALGSIAEIVYNDFNRGATTYEVEVVKITEDAYYGQITGSKFVKVFTKSRVQKATVKG